MRYLIMITIALTVTACATASSTPAGNFQTAKEQCIYRVKYPRNMKEEAKPAYLRNVALPACMAERGYR